MSLVALMFTLAVATLGLFFSGIYLYLTAAMAAAPATLVTALISLFTLGILAWIAQRLNR